MSTKRRLRVHLSINSSIIDVPIDWSILFQKSQASVCHHIDMIHSEQISWIFGYQLHSLVLAHSLNSHIVGDCAHILGPHSTLQVGSPRDLFLLPPPYASSRRLWGVRRGPQLSIISSSIFGNLPVSGLIPSPSAGIALLADPSGSWVSRRFSSSISIRTPLSSYKLLTLSAATLSFAHSPFL